MIYQQWNQACYFITDNAKAQGFTYLQEDFVAAVLGAAGHFTADDLNGKARNYGDYGLQTTQLLTKMENIVDMVEN